MVKLKRAKKCDVTVTLLNDYHCPT
jgi:hypothetical protein